MASGFPLPLVNGYPPPIAHRQDTFTNGESSASSSVPSAAPSIAPTFSSIAPVISTEGVSLRSFAEFTLPIREEKASEFFSYLPVEDLERYDQTFFDDLRQRIAKARWFSKEKIFREIDKVAAQVFNALERSFKLYLIHIGEDGHYNLKDSQEKLASQPNVEVKDHLFFKKIGSVLSTLCTFSKRPDCFDIPEHALNRYDELYFDGIRKLLYQNRKFLASTFLLSAADDLFYILKKCFSPFKYYFKDFDSKDEFKLEYQKLLTAKKLVVIHEERIKLFEKILKTLAYIQYLLDTASLEFFKPITIIVNPPVVSEGDLDKIKIAPEEIQWDRGANPLGSGSFASVSLGVWRGKKVAIKTFKFSEDTKQDELEQAWKSESLFLYQGQNCDQIVKIFGISTRGPMLYDIVMECLRSLGRVLKDSKVRLLWNDKYKITKDIFNGLKFLDSIRVVHRDIKGSNILLDDDFHAKIADFGESTFRQSTKDYSESTQMMRGTRQWMAPEVSKVKTYTHKADVYSAGTVLYELASRQSPYLEVEDEKEVNNEIVRGRTPTLLPVWPELFRLFITLCWTYSPRARPSGEQLIKIFEEEELDKPRTVRQDPQKQTVTSPRSLSSSKTATTRPGLEGTLKTRSDVPRSVNPFDINKISKRLYEYKRKELDFMALVACMDGEIRETVTLSWLGLSCILEFVNDLLALPIEKRDFQDAAVNLRKKLKELKDEEVNLYRSFVSSNPASAPKRADTDKFKDQLVVSFEQLVRKKFNEALIEFPLTPDENLEQMKVALERQIEGKLHSKDVLLESIDSFLTQSRDLKSTPQYQNLVQEREKLRGVYFDSTVWTAVEKQDKEGLQSEWSNRAGFLTRLFPTFTPASSNFINAKNKLGYAPLHIAVYNGYLDLVEDLLGKGAARSITDNDGYNALHWSAAAVTENVEVVKKLLVKDLTILNSQALHISPEGTEYGFKRTPLHRAAWHGYDQIVRVFLDYGADPNLRTSEKGGEVTPLHEAVDQKRDKAVSALLSCPRTDVEIADCNGRTPFAYAILDGKTEYAIQIYNHESYKKVKNSKDPNSPENLLEKVQEPKVRQFLQTLIDQRNGKL